MEYRAPSCYPIHPSDPRPPPRTTTLPLHGPEPDDAQPHIGDAELATADCHRSDKLAETFSRDQTTDEQEVVLRPRPPHDR